MAPDRARRMPQRPDLRALERTAGRLAAEWGVELGPPFALARHSFVAPAGDRTRCSS